MTKLEKFLRENNAWEAFKKNYDPDYKFNKGKSFVEFMFLTGNDYRGLHAAFSWASAPEMGDYWSELYCKYRDDYLNKENEIKKELMEIKKEATHDGALLKQVGGNHYKEMVIQPIEFVHKNNLNFCQGNVIKYITRYKNKNGIEDLKKVKHYAELLAKLEYGEDI
jgi:hypothetical protein